MLVILAEGATGLSAEGVLGICTTIGGVLAAVIARLYWMTEQNRKQQDAAFKKCLEDHEQARTAASEMSRRLAFLEGRIAGNDGNGGGQPPAGPPPVIQPLPHGPVTT